MSLKRGGILERAQRQAAQPGICPTCTHLTRISETALGCIAHDKFIMPDYLPYHNPNFPCPDWKPGAESKDAAIINISTIKQMRHAIGLDYKAPKRGKYEAYRNYCFYAAPHEDWEPLVAQGLAVCDKQPSAQYGETYTYSLTREGLDIMGAMIGAKITMQN